MSHETMASLSCRPCSPPPAPLEDDDLLTEILPRLPPLPSSLPRASAVCKRWRGLASDPRFICRFRAHHRRNPPLLGCFVEKFGNVYFRPALESSNRVPQGRFSVPIAAGDRFTTLGCRHGLVVIFHATRNQILVWDPVTDDQQSLDIPQGFDTVKYTVSAAVLRAAGGVHHFQVVLLGHCGRQYRHTQVLASVYSSETRAWSNIISTPLPSEEFGSVPTMVFSGMPAVMVGNSLYWLLTRYSPGIVEFDLVRRSLSFVPIPGKGSNSVVRAEGGALGFISLSGSCAKSWKRKIDCDGVASWVLEKTVALDKLLSISEKKRGHPPMIVGFAESNDVVLLWTLLGVFTIQLQSLQFKKISEPDRWSLHCPFEGVYTAETGNGGGHDGAGLLHNI